MMQAIGAKKDRKREKITRLKKCGQFIKARYEFSPVVMQKNQMRLVCVFYCMSYRDDKENCTRAKKLSFRTTPPIN